MRRKREIAGKGGRLRREGKEGIKGKVGGVGGLRRDQEKSGTRGKEEIEKKRGNRPNSNSNRGYPYHCNRGKGGLKGQRERGDREERRECGKRGD